MRRITATLFSLCTILTLAAVTASAAANTWVDIHAGSKTSGGLGMTKHLAGKMWGGLRMDGIGSSDVRASADVIYKLPKQLLVWEPYAGGGIDYDLKTGETGGHVVVGSKVLWFFAEDEFRLVDRGNTVRAGIRLAF